MTRTITTKFIATALAIASLGLAGTAQAAPDTEQNIAIGEPTPGQPVPAQPDAGGAPVDPAQPADEQAPAEAPAEEDVEDVEEDYYSSAAYFNSQEAKDRFARYCNMKDAEPSHSDKKFCEDYRRKNGGTTSSTGTGNPNTGHTGNPGHYEDTGYHEKRYDKRSPQAEAPQKGSLPFTGLEIWQLGLLGVVLVGGGFGARRLLAS